MKKILIFKTDRIGDFVYFAPCLKIIKNRFKENCQITVVCGEYNYQIVKNYKIINKIICLKNGYIRDLLKLIKSTKKEKYDYLFQFDGLNKSFFSSLLINSITKSAIFYKKKFNFLNFKLTRTRPNLFVRSFFNYSIICDQDYNIKNKYSHYQTNYFSILEKNNFQIIFKQNYFELDDSFNEYYSNFINVFNEEYYLFHLDDKSNRLIKDDFLNLIKFIDKISKSSKVVISLGLGSLKYIDILKSNFKILDYLNFKDNKKSLTNNSICLANIPLNALAFFIKNAKSCLSMHSGSIVHISAAFDVPIIDIIEKDRFNEVDRWIPTNSNYTRFDIKEPKSFRF